MVLKVKWSNGRDGILTSLNCQIHLRRCSEMTRHRAVVQIYITTSGWCSMTGNYITTANRRNLPCRSLKHYTVCGNYYHKNPLSPYNLFLVFFFIKLFLSQFCRMIKSLNFRAEGLSNITEVECQDLGRGRGSLPN